MKRTRPCSALLANDLGHAGEPWQLTLTFQSSTVVTVLCTLKKKVSFMVKQKSHIEDMFRQGGTELTLR